MRSELTDTATALRGQLRSDISDSLSQLNTDFITAIHDTAMTVRGELSDTVTALRTELRSDISDTATALRVNWTKPHRTPRSYCEVILVIPCHKLIPIL